MWQQILPGLRIKLFMTVLVGVIYPLAVTGICQFVFPHRANGSLLTVNGGLAGSELIGQSFTRPEYFQPRPSSAGGGYDATASSGSNLGPTSAKLFNGTTKTDDKKNEVVDFDVVDRYRDAGGRLDDVKLVKAFNDPKDPLVFRAKTPIPADAVTGSASGLDPDISPANAAIQAERIAKARGVRVDQVSALVREYTAGPVLGLFGEPAVNVLRLNLALDRSLPVKH